MILLYCCWCLIDVECGLCVKGHNRSRSMNIKNNEDDRKSSTTGTRNIQRAATILKVHGIYEEECLVRNDSTF